MQDSLQESILWTIPSDDLPRVEADDNLRAIKNQCATWENVAREMIHRIRAGMAMDQAKLHLAREAVEEKSEVLMNARSVALTHSQNETAMRRQYHSLNQRQEEITFQAHCAAYNPQYQGSSTTKHALTQPQYQGFKETQLELTQAQDEVEKAQDAVEQAQEEYRQVRAELDMHLVEKEARDSYGRLLIDTVRDNQLKRSMDAWDDIQTILDEQDAERSREGMCQAGHDMGH